MNTFRPGDAFYYHTVTRILGSGGNGTVYEIRHNETGDLSALKAMHAFDCLDPSKTARALAAAKGHYRIKHQNVVEVLDLNCESNGLVWMRTELLRGSTVHDLIARQGRLSLPFALAVASEAASGLAALHEHQIIHRDVKPSNLFFTDGGAVKVLDLGLAKVFPEGLETTLGRRLVLGTPAYCAPEQLDGRIRPDVRVDVYQLGICVWEMIAGQNPFADVLHDVTELTKRQLTVMPQPLATVARVPPRVDEVVMRAVAKDPAQRFRSMMEMRQALTDLSAWVQEEARARRLAIGVPKGEPPLPRDSNSRRDYRSEPTPQHLPAPSPPSKRVYVAGATPDGTPSPCGQAPSRSPLAATVPMSDAGGLASTAPLPDAAPPASPGRATPTPSTPSAPGASTPPGATALALQATMPARRDTPAAVTHTQPGVWAGRSRALPWVAVVVLLAAVSLASVAAVAWTGGRGKPAADPGPAEAASASASAEPASTSSASPLVPEEGSAPSASVDAAPQASSAPAPPARPTSGPAHGAPTRTVKRVADPLPLPAPPPPQPPPKNEHRPFDAEK